MRPDADASDHPHSAHGAPIRVVLADDRCLFRQGLKLLLNLRAGVVVVAESDDPHELPALLTRQDCDVLLLGIRFGADGDIDVAVLSTSTKVLLMCDGGDLEDAVVAMRAGAQGAVFRHTTADALVEAISTVAAGQVSMPTEMQTRLAETLQVDPQRRLTGREREVVRHVARGLRNAEVARELFITEQTVKTHLGNIFRKTGVRDRVELALYAVRLGLVVLSTPPR